MIVNKEGRYFFRVYFAPLDVLGVNAGNVLAFVYRDQGENFLRLSMRFRYYEDDKLGPESKDRRSAYEGQSPPGASLANVVPMLRFIFNTAGAGEYEELIIESSDPAVMFARLKEQPWIHMSEAPKGES